ncbi:MAG: hypothetical protein NTW96_10450 [Planctomycetia bacterium]|nr:hypothetical protein [Planctomycetia bacterium]
MTVDAIVGVQVLYYRQLGLVESSDALYPPSAELDSQLAAQQRRLTDYWVVDPKKNVVAIPVSRTMELVTAELSVGQDSRD